MSERPTRSEAVRVAHEAARRPGMEWAAEKIALAVADLFGGCAPEPCEVPRLRAMVSIPTTFLAVGVAGSVSQDEWREIFVTVAARSNAWEELLKSLEGATRLIEDGYNRRALAEIVNTISSMRRPEMGVGPR